MNNNSLENSFRSYRRLRFLLNAVLICAILVFVASSLYFVSRNYESRETRRKAAPGRVLPNVDFVAVDRSKVKSQLASLTLADERDYADVQLDDILVR